MYVSGRECEAFLNCLMTNVGGPDLTFRVHYWGAAERHFDNPVHKHSFYEVCYVFDGEGTYMDDGIDFPLQTGTLFLSRPHVVHQIRSAAGLYLLYVAYEVDAAASAREAAQRYRQLADTQRFVCSGMEEHPVGLMWRAQLQQSAGAQPASREALAALSYALLAAFPAAFGADDARSGRVGGNSASSIVHQAKLFVRDNLSRPLPIDEVAKFLHLSPRHVTRLFKAETGESLQTYVGKERIRQAAHLLRTDRFTIKQAAEETGFGSVHYFTRVFTEAMKVTPGRYRRLKGGGEPDGPGSLANDKPSER